MNNMKKCIFTFLVWITFISFAYLLESSYKFIRQGLIQITCNLKLYIRYKPHYIWPKFFSVWLPFNLLSTINRIEVLDIQSFTLLQHNTKRKGNP